MSCGECEYTGRRCEYCTENHISDIKRRAKGYTVYRKAFKKSKMFYKKKCTCCTDLNLAIVYRDCPADMYVGHKDHRGLHCVKNLKYFVKQSLTKK